ncbi:MULTISPECIES: hypothetical protein [Brevibacillus]|uniref:Uncharacterized protein n=3 Tax=Brevibacillus TaxID=55080 RepID=A0A938Y3Q5_9BACL|nr:MULTISPECIES: hypothetical protein [Brevibacillus]MBM7591779.1 hypothetical protein [Brevibacillus fulvus]QAV11853.1 hypothetical protein BA6348_03235 [Brevibacillus agri]RNB51708.1 hypothetical protein EB820_19580 [Brevibacillus agri]
MAGTKVALNRSQKMLSQLEKQDREQIQKRIARLGFVPDEVLATLPLEKRATRARLLVFLEYEEINQAYACSHITEIHYSCTFYPSVMIEYLHYMLDEVGLLPAEEIDVYRDLIVATNPDVMQNFDQLERKWRACLAQV